MVDLKVLKRVAQNVRAAYYGENCVEAQYIDLAIEEIEALCTIKKEMYEALKGIGQACLITEYTAEYRIKLIEQTVDLALAKAEGK